MTRVYVPASVADLTSIAAAQPLVAEWVYAVSPELRTQLDGSEEELEAVALLAAAFAALELLGEDRPARRVVLACDVEPDRLAFEPDYDVCGAQLTGAIEADEVAAAFLDDVANSAVLTRLAAGELDEAGADELADLDLQWYAADEISSLVGR